MMEDISLIAFFLRINITDPKSRISKTGDDTETLSSEKIVSVTSSQNISHVSNVKIDTVLQTPFKDYVYDIKNRKIVFYDDQTGDLTYDIYGGTNWIYDDKPREKLSTSSYPRISLRYVSRIEEIKGNYDAPSVTTNRIQLDVWSYKDEIFTIDIGDYDSNLSDDKLTMYIATQCSDTLKSNAFDLTSESFSDYVPISKPTNSPYNKNYNLYDSRFEFFVKSIKC